MKKYPQREPAVWTPELRRRPRGEASRADFSVTVTDDAMEPYIKKGETVYVSRRAFPRPGEAGIFYVRGRMVCRQYVEDSEGTVYLFAANRKRRELDEAVPAGDPAGVQLFGGLVPPRSIPLPGIEE